MGNSDKDRHGQSLGILSRLQRTLIRRLMDYVVENESSLRMAVDGTEGYGFTLHQLDELFLGRLNIVERGIAELQKSPSGGGCRYRALCFRAPYDSIEGNINSRLEKVSDARILGVSVSAASSVAPPGSAGPAAGPVSRGGGAKGGADATGRAVPSPTRSVGPQSGAAQRPALRANAPGDLPASPAAGTGDGASRDELLVTVVYYGPAPAPESA